MYFESCKIFAKVSLKEAKQETINLWFSLNFVLMRNHLKRECERIANWQDKSQWNYANVY